MAREYIPIDISNAPDLERLAEAVRQSGKPHALKEGAETVAIVRPAPKSEGAAGSRRGGSKPRRTAAASMDDPAFAKLLEDARQANRAVPVNTAALFAPPTPEQTAKRRAVLAQIQEHLPQRVIAPLTASDLIHEARGQEEEAYGRGR
jgi:hypothetical protein